MLIFSFDLSVSTIKLLYKYTLKKNIGVNTYDMVRSYVHSYGSSLNNDDSKTCMET